MTALQIFLTLQIDPFQDLEFNFMSSPNKKSLVAFYRNPSDPIFRDTQSNVDQTDSFTLNSRCISLALKKLTGNTPQELLRPQEKPDDLVSILETNSHSYRYLSLSSLDINGYFGFIIANNQRSKCPELLFYSGTTPYRFLSQDLSTVPLTSKNLIDYEDACIEIFSPLPAQTTSDRIAGYAIKSSEFQFLLIFLFGIIVSIFQLLIPVISATLVSSSIPDGNLLFSYELSLVLVFSSFMAFLFMYYQVRFVSVFNTIILSKLQIGIWQKLAALPVLFIQKFPQQELVQRAGSLVQIQALIGTQIVPAFISLVFGLAYFLLMVYYGGNFAYVSFACYLVFSIVSIPLFQRQSLLQQNYNNISSQFAAQVQNSLSGISLLKATDTETTFLDSIMKRLSSLNKRELDIAYVDSFTDMLSLLSQPIVYIVVFSYFTLTTTSRELDPGALSKLVGFLTSLAGFNSSFSLVLYLVSSNLVKAAANWSYVQPILQSEREPLGFMPVHNLKGCFEFDNVSFSYSPDSQTLSDLNLIIPSGVHTAITGPSGSGKSTILRLCTGTIRPDSGIMRVDGIDYQSLNLKSLRLQIGIVTQQVNLPQAMIRDVLDPLGEYPKSRLLEYLDYACIREEIEAMPMGLDTILTPGATNISGGQRQRLLLARALIREPNVLFLDEATSALDIEAQRAISEFLDSSKITRITIAHRLETIRNADNIVVLEAGKKTQQGTYSELIRQDGFFRSAFAQ